ncbi:PREDICTED: uncharacterized protein LOC104822343 [Tarenaya hassleriana]|uniref:uncharacterized protein LOC104822343 n=1 Tax=Tarenaya hassleriana TaxID=28532 RepID=UPI00053C20AA|nr:PREDICTED: uncharacterized protein LOC104822343 [Tarenaya hassleriana]
MAEECISLPDSPDVSRSWRRISTGKLSLLYTEEKILPNYLRAPAGSCHDVCKYGTRHESVKKARGSTLKRVVKKLPHDKIPSPSLDSPLTKSSALAKKVTKPSSNGSDVKREGTRFPGRTGDVKKREASTGVSVEVLASVNNKISPEKAKKKMVSSSESRLTSSITRKPKVVQSSSTVFVPPGRASLGSREITELKKRATLSKLKSVSEKGSYVQDSRKENSTMAMKKVGVLKAADRKDGVLPGRASSLSRKTYPDRSGSVKVKKGSSLSAPPLKNRKGVRSTEAEKSGLKPGRGNGHKDLVEEKTLYVIKMETENAVVESVRNERCIIDSPTTDPSSSPSQQRVYLRKKRQEESESTVTEAEDEISGNRVTEEDDEEEDGDDESLPDGKRVPIQRRNRDFSSEDAVKDKAVKLKFKSGKTVETASPWDNSPRRLKFRRGRVLSGDESNPKSSRRSFKTKGSTLNREEHKPRSSVKISLRHQDTERKKDHSRGLLFNNVIEETASKLVETRKSKVKALVGAFETVISLQETKPLTG